MKFPPQWVISDSDSVNEIADTIINAVEGQNVKDIMFACFFVIGANLLADHGGDQETAERGFKAVTNDMRRVLMARFSEKVN